MHQSQNLLGHGLTGPSSPSNNIIIQHICIHTSIHTDRISLDYLIHCIAGYFCVAQILQMVDPYHFAGLIFADTHTHADYVLYNRAYFVCLSFDGYTQRTNPTQTYLENNLISTDHISTLPNMSPPTTSLQLHFMWYNAQRM